MPRDRCAGCRYFEESAEKGEEYEDEGACFVDPPQRNDDGSSSRGWWTRGGLLACEKFKPRVEN